MAHLPTGCAKRITVTRRPSPSRQLTIHAEIRLAVAGSRLIGEAIRERVGQAAQIRTEFGQASGRSATSGLKLRSLCRFGTEGSEVRILSPRPNSLGPFWADRWQFIPAIRSECAVTYRSGGTLRKSLGKEALATGPLLCTGQPCRDVARCVSRWGETSRHLPIHFAAVLPESYHRSLRCSQQQVAYAIAMGSSIMGGQ
jgi:hypothetical protein